MPIVTFALILVNAIVFVYLQGSGKEPKFTSFTYSYCMIPREVSSGHDLVTAENEPGLGNVGYTIPIRERDTGNKVASIDPNSGTDSIDAKGLPRLNSDFPRLQESPSASATLFTYMFLHANWVHLLANMTFLFSFGCVAESILGHVKYLLLYLISGVLSGLTTTLVTLNSIEAFFPALGASGAIAGILGACVILRPNISIHLPHEIGRGGLWVPLHEYPPWMGWIYAGLWGLNEMINAIAKCKHKDAIMIQITNCKAEWLSHVSHAGGFISGVVIATAGASTLAFLVCFSPALWPLIRDLVRRW